MTGTTSRENLERILPHEPIDVQRALAPIDGGALDGRDLVTEIRGIGRLVESLEDMAAGRGANHAINPRAWLTTCTSKRIPNNPGRELPRYHRRLLSQTPGVRRFRAPWRQPFHQGQSFRRLRRHDRRDLAKRQRLGPRHHRRGGLRAAAQRPPSEAARP